MINIIDYGKIRARILKDVMKILIDKNEDDDDDELSDKEFERILGDSNNGILVDTATK